MSNSRIMKKTKKKCPCYKTIGFEETIHAPDEGVGGVRNVIFGLFPLYH
tara:strand:+ start:522 stop:668 length:147 start_codon:yes stop_codon:yes gene_type:complete